MKTKLLILISLWLISSYTQWGYAQYRIVNQSQDLTSVVNQNTTSTSDTSDQIVAIESRGMLSKYLIVRYAHARRKLLLKNSIWGFVDSRQAVWRSYKKELFLILKYNNNWVEYAIERPVRTRLTATYPAVMYSRSLDSKIRATWADAMKDIPLGYVIH